MDNKYLNLTEPQKAIWNTEQFYPNTSINTITAKISIHAEINKDLLEKAIYIVVQNVPDLRVQLNIKNEVVTQYHTEYKPFKVEYVEFTPENEENLTTMITRTAFSLFNSPLFRFTIFKNSDKTGGFFLCVHHILSDAWAMSSIVSLVVSIYSKLLKKEKIDSNSFEYYSYSDFIESENNYILSPKYTKDKQFWNDLFSDDIFNSSFSETDSLIGSPDGKATRSEFVISKEITKKINDFCKEIKVSPFTFILFVMGVYKSKVSQNENIVLSSPILNRSTYKEKNTFGIFVNNMLYKLDIKNDKTFLDALIEASKNQFSYLRHQKYPSQNLIADIKSRFNIKENIYNTSVSYQNAKTKHVLGDVSYDSKWLFCGYSGVPLLFHIYDVDDTKSYTFMYDFQNAVYDYKQIKDIHNRLLFIIKQVIENRNILIKDISLTTKEEKDIILNEFNNTFLNYNHKETIVDLFEKQVALNPKKIAIICDNKEFSYENLDLLSSKLANYLQKNYKFEVGDNISIILDRSAELIVTILAVLKCGCSYVLIDTSHPAERKEYMINNSNSKFVISNFSFDFDNLIKLDNILELDISPNYRVPEISSNDNMYLLYTSGTTGKPKGVTITHRNFHNYVLGISKVVTYSKDKNILSMASISFDVFGYELWATILNGLTLVLTTNEEQNDFVKLNDLMIKNKVNIIYGTPSKIQSLMSASNFIDSFKLLTDIGIGGENLNLSFVKNIKLITSAKIYNMYGPTEATVGCCAKEISPSDKVITIGKPMANVKFYVLDNNFNLCPPGIKGELYISGDGISKGYYGRDDLNKKSFIPDIFYKNKTMYKSGDIVSWTKSGELIFYGRADSQIKIRGYRIELSEIEKVLHTHPFIKSCAVINYKHNERDFLCCYYTSDFTIQNYELKIFLAKKLPNYMIPSYFIAMQSLPLTVNGKLDRKKLPSPFNNKEEKYVKPETSLQKTICKILEECLSIKNISIYEDFNNLGLDSLTVIKIQSKLSDLNISIPTQYFYDYSNVKDLCFALENIHLEDDSNLSNDTYSFLKHDLGSIKPSKFNYKNILLTGATGFLGIHILDALLQDNCKIYCLIRATNVENAKKRLLSMFNFYFENKYTKDFLFNKINVIVGDITYENLKLSDDILNTLPKNIDLLIHSAALVKHIGKYAEFEKMNITGTKNIINFCEKYDIDLSYISTISVSGDFMPLNSTSDNVNYNEESFFIGQNYNDNYYIKSKLLAEEEILNNIKSKKINANIFRVGNLSSRYSDAKFQYNIDSNAFYNKLQFIIKNKVFFESGTIQEFDISPVDFVAKAIVDINKNYGTINKIFHIFNPTKFTMKSLIDMLNILNCNIKIVSDENFYKKISKFDLASNSLIINDYNLYTNISYLNIKTTCDITLKYLDKIGFKYGKIDLEYLSKLITYLKDIKFI